jgi:predicted Zn-dependent peptidase
MTPPRVLSGAAGFSFLALLLAAPAHAAEPTDAKALPEIPYEVYRLDNGLEVILHRDDSVPTVHTELWYKVGSKDEVPGKTGFAHLFEHIMFQGTKHIPEDAHFKYLQEAGASNINGTTSFDRTNYYQTVPANQLGLALWLESSRMGFLLDRASFKETLDNQRDVVKNERRQRVENQPMGKLWEVMLANLYPDGHPYQHEVIGSMADLTAASTEDIRSFFKKYYAPNNAVLVIAGRFDPADAKAQVEKYFGPIPSGPPVTRQAVPPARLGGQTRIDMEAKISLPKGHFIWLSVPFYAPGDADLDVLSSVLAGGKSSRLYKRLVYDMKIAQDVDAFQWSLMHGGVFQINFTPLPGHTIAEVAKVVDEELARVRKEPITDKELARVKYKIKTTFFSQLEPIAGRAGLLAQYNYFAGDPGFMAKDLARYEAVTPASVQKAANALLDPQRRLIIDVHPNPAAPIMGRIKNVEVAR